MVVNQTVQPQLRPNTHVARVANILPATTAMPLECDACDHEQNYSMQHLRSLPKLTCKECGDSRAFSQVELSTLEKALNQMGYYLSKKSL